MKYFFLAFAWLLCLWLHAAIASFVFPFDPEAWHAAASAVTHIVAFAGYTALCIYGAIEK